MNINEDVSEANHNTRTPYADPIKSIVFTKIHPVGMVFSDFSIWNIFLSTWDPFY